MLFRVPGEKGAGMDRPRPDSDRIREELWRAVEQARQKYEEAVQNFRALLTELPLGRPDGAARIKQGGTIQHEASVQYMEALKKYTDFILGRKIPKDDA